MPSSSRTPSSSGSGSTPGSRSGSSSAGSRSASSSFAATAASPAQAPETEPEPTDLKLTAVEPEVRQPAELPVDASIVDRLKAVLEKQRRMFLVTLLDSAQALEIESGELYIEFSPESRHLRDTVSRPENIKLLREACLELTGKETGVRIAVKDVNEDQDQPLSREEEERLRKQSLRASLESNPVVQEMLRKFRGEIVEVRRLDGGK